MIDIYKLPHDKTNVNGGAIGAFSPPLGSLISFTYPRPFIFFSNSSQPSVTPSAVQVLAKSPRAFTSSADAAARSSSPACASDSVWGLQECLLPSTKVPTVTFVANISFLSTARARRRSCG